MRFRLPPAAFWLAGAATFSWAAAEERIPAGTPSPGAAQQGPVLPKSDARLLGQVPFYPDDSDQCGPSALASVLAYWGVPLPPSSLKKEIYSPRLSGTLPMDLAPAARAHGLQARAISGSLEGLKEAIRRGHPWIVLLNQGTRSWPLDHFAVVTGFDDRRGGVYLHSGLKRNRFVAYKNFVKKWDRADRWALWVFREEKK